MSNSNQTTFSFAAEIPKLMNMIIHNFYSSKEIFLRELISNASDAIDKSKFYRIQHPINFDDTDQLKHSVRDITDYAIKIIPNKENNTLTIEDNGVGMTMEELHKCLGTIAKSGTEEFVKNILSNANKNSANSNQNNLIGQFGVGFYSAFLVADNVNVYTKSSVESDSKLLLWSSDAKNGYTVSECESNELFDNSFIGTRIILQLNKEQFEYLEESRLEEIIRKHSGYISYPIMLQKRVKVETTNQPVEQETTQPVEQETVEQETVEQETVEQEIVEQETVEQEKVEQETVEQETV